MLPLRSFENYKDKYENFRFERRGGILQVTLHTGGEDIVWGYEAHREAELVLADIGLDPENEVIILTGAGDAFLERSEPLGPAPSAEDWGQEAHWAIKRLMMSHLDIQVPMIAAVNGPATYHADMALLCDIVVASDTAVFSDSCHFPDGQVPGDGVQVLWPMLLGLNRARYFLLTGQEIGAKEALRLGIVGEVLPRDQVLPRAWQLAEWIMTRPPVARRLTREALTVELRRAMTAHLGYGSALQGLASTVSWGVPPGLTRCPPPPGAGPA